MSQKYHNGDNHSINSHMKKNIEEIRVNNRRKNIQKTIWMYFFGVISVLSVGLSIYFGFNYKTVKKSQLTSDEYYKNQSVNNCRRSMFNISDGLQNSDANIGKLLVSNDKKFIINTLIEMEGIAQSSVADLSYIPIKRDISICCAKYFNQLGDYCKSLTKSVEDRGLLSEEQKNSLVNLRKVGNKLQTSINTAIKNDDSLVWGSENGNYTFEVKLDQIDENTFDYPQLVYDGPFSDSVTERSFDREILTVAEVEKILVERFKDYSVKDIEFISKADNRATVYYFILNLNGKEYSVTTATDGTVAELNNNGEKVNLANLQIDTMQNEKTSNFEQDEVISSCCDVAEKMAKTLGFDVLPMWVSEPIEGRVYVNMISRQNDVNIYPDMVKMAIDVDSRTVVGLDAFGYIANHRERKIIEDIITIEDAHKKLAVGLDVERTEICIVPDGNDEVLCYEIRVNSNDEKFLIYINAQTGEEVDILKIIEDKLGYTVM